MNFRTPATSKQRFRQVLALGPLLLLAACHSRQDKANRYEAAYDALMAANALQPAMMAMSRAVEYDDDEPRRWLKLARVQQMMNLPAAAAVSYQHALDLQPASVEALENLAVLSVRGNEYTNAKRYIDPLLVLDPNDLAGLLVSGAIALHERRYSDADVLAGKLIAGAPDRAEGYIMRARVLDATGHTPEAIALLEPRAKADPKNSDVLLQLMILYKKQGDRGGIRATAIRLMPLFPNDTRYAMEAARAYNDAGQPDRVHEIITDLSTRFGRNAQVMTAIAQFWREHLPLSQAKAEIAASAEKASPRVRVALADFLANLGDPAGAAAILAPLAPPKVTLDTIDGQAAYARAQFNAGRQDIAIPKMLAILKLDESNPVALLLRARVEFAKHDYPAALKDAQRVSADDDSNIEAGLLVGRIYAASGNQVLAAKAFGNARENAPDDSNVLRAEAAWLMSQNRGSEAADRAIAFAHAHDRRIDAWTAARDICTAAKATDCAEEARQRLLKST